MENPNIIDNQVNQKVVQNPKTNYMVIGLVILVCFVIFGFGGFFLGKQSSKNSQEVRQGLIQPTSYSSPIKSINSPTPAQPTSTDVFDLEKLVFPSLSAGFSVFKIKDESTQIVHTITIEHKKDETSEPVVVAEISNRYPFQFYLNNSDKKQSKFGEVAFLGKRYQFYIRENTMHGDGPALNEGDCSYSGEGDTHYFMSEEKIYISIREITSSSFCNGKTTEEILPTEEDIKTAFNIIENIKLKQ